jgi:hypothetical protein
MNLDFIQTFIEQVGETVTIQRLFGPQQIPFSVDVKAFCVGFQPQELVDPIIQGAQKITIGHKEIAERQWPGPPRKGDRIIIRGRESVIEACDVVNIGTTICRYNLHVRGAEQ